MINNSRVCSTCSRAISDELWKAPPKSCGEHRPQKTESGALRKTAEFSVVFPPRFPQLRPRTNCYTFVIVAPRPDVFRAHQLLQLLTRKNSVSRRKKTWSSLSQKLIFRRSYSFAREWLRSARRFRFSRTFF